MMMLVMRAVELGLLRVCLRVLLLVMLLVAASDFEGVHEDRRRVQGRLLLKLRLARLR